MIDRVIGFMIIFLVLLLIIAFLLTFKIEGTNKFIPSFLRTGEHSIRNGLNVEIKINGEIIQPNTSIYIDKGCYNVYILLKNEWILYLKNLEINKDTEIGYSLKTRKIGAQSIYKSALGGMTYIYFHNNTEIPLIINGVNVAPHSSNKYIGDDGYGIPLGTILTDGIHQPIHLIKNITDIYYGTI